LRALAFRIAPALVAERDRRYEQALRARLGVPQTARAWTDEHGDQVAAGPFAGLQYPAELLATADAPLLKIQGRYELPLQPALEQAIRAIRGRPGSVFVDAGSADGYYAAGVGRAAACVVHAFDLSRSARDATRALAAANGVEVRIGRGASERALLRLAPLTGALLCDIEGAEVGAITARLAEALREAVVVVELHTEEARRDVPSRFHLTHSIEILDSNPQADEEMRTSPTPWLVALPRQSP
jgi:hypothetical protein